MNLRTFLSPLSNLPWGMGHLQTQEGERALPLGEKLRRHTLPQATRLRLNMPGATKVP